MKNVTSLLDEMISATPQHPGVGGIRKMMLLISTQMHRKLCKELKRNVRTYKGFKIVSKLKLP
jgi:hypothetical protein